MPARTQRQQEVLDIIERHIAVNGYRPSYQRIASLLRLSSRAGVARIVQDLEKQGLLSRSRENGHFSIELNTASNGVAIPWVGNDASGDEPLALARFMIGDYAPESMRLFRVNDDGMSPEIKLDDVAIIELRDYSRPDQTILAKLPNGELTLRKYSRTGPETTLRPANEAFETIHVPTNRLQIIGIHRGLLRPAA